MHCPWVGGGDKVPVTDGWEGTTNQTNIGVCDYQGEKLQESKQKGSLQMKSSG